VKKLLMIAVVVVVVVVVVVAGPVHAATHDDEVRQFAYGRDLVAHCRSAVRDPFTYGSCETQAVWWTAAGCCVPSVPFTIEWGANYQMLAMMREAGLSLGVPTDVWDVIKTRFHRDPTEYCAYFRVDCTPVLAELAAKKSELEGMDKFRGEMDGEARRSVAGDCCTETTLTTRIRCSFQVRKFAGGICAFVRVCHCAPMVHLRLSFHA
jgi:hypothetical protein